MRAGLFACLLALAPVTAEALSCRPHAIEAAFLQAQEDEASFVIVQGRLDFDRGQMPNKHLTPDAHPQSTVIDARLTGSMLTAKGFATPYNKPVRVSVACYGPWCANVQRGGQMLAFVELGEEGRVIATNPCGGYLFQNPTPKMLRAVKSCFAGNDCTPHR